jgi:hypothetical protein
MVLQEEKYFSILPQSNPKIPLLDVKVEGDMIDFLGKVKITQRFRNDYEKNIEAKYMFNLDDRSTVVGMSMILGGKKLVSEIKKKVEARKDYEKAIAEQKTTGLLEMAAQGIYTINLGNIAPQEEITIEVDYITELECSEDGEMKFLLPTNISPKYDASQKTVNDLLANQATTGQLTYSDSALYNFHLNINWQSNQKIKRVYSLTSEIEVTGVDEKKVNIQCKTMPSKGDFNLFLQTEEIGPSLYIQKDAEEGETFLMLTNRIKDEEENEAHKNYEEEGEGLGNTEYIVILDRSGSMESSMYGWSGNINSNNNNNNNNRRNKIDFAIEATELFIQSLPANSSFNVISFGSTYESLFPYSVEYTEANKEKALTSISTFQANFGGTELFNCLTAVLTGEMRPGGRGTAASFTPPPPPPTDLKKREWKPETAQEYPQKKSKENEQRRNRTGVIILITDGDVTNPDAVIALAKQFQHNYRIFAIGIGQDVNRHLVREIAKNSNALSEILLDNPDISTVVAKMLDSANKQYYTSTVMKITQQPGGRQTEVEKLQELIYPNQFNHFFHKMPTVLFEESVQSIELTSSNELTGRSVSWQFPVDAKSGNNIQSEFVRQLYAANLIKQLEKQDSSVQTTDKIVKLSTKYQIMNQRTSFIVVDHEKKVNSDQSGPIPVVVPQHDSFLKTGAVRGGNSGSVFLASARGNMMPSSFPSRVPTAQPSSCPSSCPSSQPSGLPAGYPIHKYQEDYQAMNIPAKERKVLGAAIQAELADTIDLLMDDGNALSGSVDVQSAGVSLGAVVSKETEMKRKEKEESPPSGCLAISDLQSNEAFEMLLKLKHVDGSFEKNDCSLHLLGVSAAEITTASQSKGLSEEIVFQTMVLEKWKANKEKKYVMIIRNLEKWLKSKGFEKI